MAAGGPFTPAASPGCARGPREAFGQSGPLQGPADKPASTAQAGPLCGCGLFSFARMGFDRRGLPMSNAQRACPGAISAFRIGRVLGLCMKTTLPKPPSHEKGLKRLRQLLRSRRQTDLKWYYQVGKTVQAIYPVQTGRSYGDSIVSQLAKALEASQAHYGQTALMDLMWRARDFVLKYSPTQVKRLSAVKKTSGYRFAWTHITYLLGAEDEHRKQLQAECWKQEWSTGRLLAEVKRRRGGKLSGGGRRPPVPASQEAALVQIGDMAERWLRWYEGLRGESEATEGHRVGLRDLPTRVRRQLAATMRAMEVLREENQEALQAAAKD